MVRPSRITIGRSVPTPARERAGDPGVVAAANPRSEPGCQSYRLCGYGPQVPVQSAPRRARPCGAGAAPGEPSGHHRFRDHSQEDATDHAGPAPAARPPVNGRPAEPGAPQVLQRSRHRRVRRAPQQRRTARLLPGLCAGTDNSTRGRGHRARRPPSSRHAPEQARPSAANVPTPAPERRPTSPRVPRTGYVCPRAPEKASYAFTICWTSLCRTTSFSSK